DKSLFACNVSVLFIVCAGIPEFKTKTYHVGERIILKCPRPYRENELYKLHWIRFLSGNLPEVLGATYAFDYKGVNETPHFTAKQDKGTFDLIIDDAKPSDTGFYYCVKVELLEMEFVSATFLKNNGKTFIIVALTMSLIVIIILICYINKRSCVCFNGERQNVQNLALNGNHKRFCFSWTKSKRRNVQR
uniref:Ig-like domain-containing protein n=1 Tax=Neogobius melanostomus TaxID=47308 RepID=A0A8C6WR50_9GOBI